MLNLFKFLTKFENYINYKIIDSNSIEIINTRCIDNMI